MNDPFIQGNKWLKLRPNLIAAKAKGINKLLTFGGCYSNHIYATAAAGKRFGFETIGIIRGPEPENYSNTLNFAKKAGMQLQFINRQQYRSKNDPEFIEELSRTYQPVYIIPEGGSNNLAVESCAQYIQNISPEYDVIGCSCGTGGTIAGFIKGLNNSRNIIGFPALKGGDFLYQEIQSFLKLKDNKQQFDNWTLKTDYHFGGYAKCNSQLKDFIVNFYERHNIPLEPVYTGKMMFGLFDLIQKGHFKKDSHILAIHSGGLQGLDGFPDLKKEMGLK